MATVAGGVSTQGVVVSTLDEVAMAAAVAVMAMLEVPSFRGDDIVRDLAVAGLGTEQAGDIKRGSTFNNNTNRFGYGGNQQRWNTGRGGAYVNRPRAQGTEGATRSSIDADLLQQTVQAVVAAVTAAAKVTESPAVHAPLAATGVDGTGVAATGVVDGQQLGLLVAVPNPIVQQKVTAQGIPEANEIAAKGKDNEGQGPLKKKKEDKAGCFRCKKPGHYIDDCPTPFCDICESIHHATPACHLLNAPKPTATLHGYANETLMFFELPCGAFKAKAENPKLAKVIVDGAVMTIPEIIEQLKKIVPSEKFNWEVFHLKDNIFRVKLPNSDMFIRRGFFKLCFEVEIADQSQEVNMVDANNGFDGNDGANQGEGKYGGGHDMDMDNKGNDMDATSKNDEQDASSMHNGVDGMQEQLCNLDAIQIGTRHVKLAPTDTLPRGSSSGSVAVGAWDLGRQPAVGQLMATSQPTRHAANGEELLPAGRQMPQCLPVPSCPLSSAALARARDSHADSVGHLRAATCGRDAGGGSSVAEERRPAVSASPVP
ncbi:hypothetical protein ACQ4PT_056930 [Festuca glaucescens]